jgi:DNA-binding transcriptional regulator YdaS (Cro superfamily)
MRVMDLNEYLSLPDAPSASDFARQLSVNPDQIRQWRHKYDGRQPSPESCVQIEQKTKGLVRRQDLRPDDWHRIWPELVKAKPRKPAKAA